MEKNPQGHVTTASAKVESEFAEIKNVLEGVHNAGADAGNALSSAAIQIQQHSLHQRAARFEAEQIGVKSELAETQQGSALLAAQLQSMAAGMDAIGIKSVMYHDGIRISGNPAAVFNTAEIDSQGDHRIAMAFAVASLRSAAPLVIRDCANVATSFPNFVELSARLGLEIGVERS